jgi:hypothetical protein
MRSRVIRAVEWFEADCRAREGSRDQDGVAPGWDQVEHLREEANALQHRAGLMVDERVTPPQTPLSMVQLSTPALMQPFIGARSWRLPWWDPVEPVGSTPRAV